MNARTARNLLAAVAAGVWLYGGVTAAVAQNACCVETECYPVEDIDTCNVLGGVFLPGADCADDPCGIGACCAASACVMTDAYSCIIAGRDFMGAGTDCADDPCGLDSGACCLEGECSILSPDDCASIGGTMARSAAATRAKSGLVVCRVNVWTASNTSATRWTASSYRGWTARPVHVMFRTIVRWTRSTRSRATILISSWPSHRKQAPDTCARMTSQACPDRSTR